MILRSSPTICEILEWDSVFFGLRIARFSGSTYGRVEAEAASRFCAEHEIDCLYILIDAAQIDAVHVAEERGSRLVDIRVTLERTLSPAAPRAADRSAAIRPATDRDLPQLQRIARGSHRETRFYADPGFDRERCHALYETWIEKSCRGYADAVFVVEYEGAAGGYVTCHRESDNTGRIGLIAVTPALRSRGLGNELVRTALEWFASQSLQSACVSTQGRNGPALRLSERNGFVTASVHLWFHLWPSRR